MKRLLLPFVVLGLVLACQAAEITLRPTPDAAPAGLGEIAEDRACTRAYRHQDTWLIERRCADSSPGIILVDAAGTRRFASYDSAFTDWAWQEECNREEDCYYTLSLDRQGRIAAFAYHFDINLSDGVIRVRVERDRLVVTDKRITDRPS